MSRPAEILLLSETLDRRRQWVEMLASTSTRIWNGMESLPESATLDVIVTDGHVLGAELGSRGQGLACGEIGVVAAGAGGPADVSLPANFTPRELRLSCLLLTEIVRLRRERREERRARKVLQHLAFSDPLTGLANRRAWDEELAAHIKTETAACCLALLDLDWFKQVNDELGHAAGDEVLKTAADALLASIRSDDFAARLGGDEFAVLLAEIQPESAAEVVERIRQGLCAALADKFDRPITATAGFALSTPNRRLDVQRLFLSADEALRRAKRAGRNRTLAAER